MIGLLSQVTSADREAYGRMNILGDMLSPMQSSKYI